MSLISQGEQKRKAIFKKYSNNLNILKANGFLPDIQLKYAETYICPICLQQFSETDVSDKATNHLTLEDVPPKSLGGKPIILTCKSCNNTIGHKIDYHLLDRMLEMDMQQFLPNAERRGVFNIGGETVNGVVSVTDKGEIRIYHAMKANHPTKLQSAIDKLKAKFNKPKIDAQFESKADPRKLQLALLKIGYLMTFAKFGYAFILDESYSRVRQQLLDPEKSIYPTDFWFSGPFPKEQFGVPFITEKGMEAAFPLFSLTTKSSERIFGTIIPLSTKPIESVISELTKRFAMSQWLNVSMYAFNGPTDYLTNVDATKLLVGWINNIK